MDTVKQAENNNAFLGVEESLTGRYWQDRLTDERLAMAIAQRHHLPDLVARILAARGVGCDEAPAYLSPSLKSDLPDPSMLQDMDKAAARLADAIEAGEKIAVFGDYDVDGATSCALLQRYLAAIGVPLHVYIPDRVTEGYGPNTPALLKLREQETGVLITVDCGISAHEPLGAARDAGLDVIVADHHLAEPELPPAFAIVNPNRLDDESGLGQLAAVGVTFLLVVALNRELRRRGIFDGRSEPDLIQWLDLVALGTVCDVVPLTGVNRVLVSQGLKIMAGRSNTGISALCDVARLDDVPGVYHVGFILGPRVNAGGRIGLAEYGARLLATDDSGEAHRIARELDAFNSERKEIESRVLDEARAVIEQRGLAENPVIVVPGEGWHPGVIGIVASRLKEKYQRPVAVVAIDEGIGKASARSIAGVDIGGAVTAARQAGLLINGGGHAMAAGFTVAASSLDALDEFICRRLTDQVTRATGRRVLNIDAALSVAGADSELCRQVAQAGPFGAGNPEPRFAVVGARIINPDIIGENHVRCLLGGADSGRLPAIAFRSTDGPVGSALMSAKGRPLHVAGHLRLNNWQGRERVQFVIDDVAEQR